MASTNSLYIFVGLFIFCSKAYGRYRYDYKYNQDAKGWLKLHKIPANFKDAFLRCAFEDAVLASPLNSDLHNVLTSIINESELSNGIYTGIHALYSHGDYSTVEGVPLERLSIEWAMNEPDNYVDKEDCLIMHSNGTIADVLCSMTYPFVCYKAKTKNLLITECGTADYGYKHDNRTGSCYKFHWEGISWRRAYSVCQAEGGHLAIINSKLEAHVIKELFAKHPQNSIISDFPDTASIGFSAWETGGLWFTIHGETLTQAGYSTWDNDQPNKLDRNQFCGAVSRSGTLNDIWCDTKEFAYICEKTPESLLLDEENVDEM